jgi:hypothetical protein
MRLKTKLSLGLGFLFLIIFALAIICSLYVGKMAQEAEGILKDNYNSLVYSKNMNVALDDMCAVINRFMLLQATDGVRPDYYWRAFDAGQELFARNAKAESNNITEIQENEYVATLTREYDSFLRLCAQVKNGLRGDAVYLNEFTPVYEKLKKTLNTIYDINMQAVVRKSQLTKSDSVNFITYMAAIGSFCIILAFLYFWYFPFYTSNTIHYLAERLTRAMKNAGLAYDSGAKDEMRIFLQAIAELEHMLAKESLKAGGHEGS